MPASAKPKIKTESQVSAGGVVYRKRTSGVEIAIIKVGPVIRWQLPKGIVDEGETPEQAAIREVREETGLNAKIESTLETIEYHKFVHFYLMKYASGKTDDHDHEVIEARWVSAVEAIRMLSFKSERDLAEKARQMIDG
jgi:8-oxo-dGTP pyrophosphatase MutT (NUDIX family)